MDSNTHNISIISDQKVRARIIQNLIKKGIDPTVTVTVVGSEDYNIKYGEFDKHLILVDLISIEKPSRLLIKEIRETMPGVKIIALHIYRSLMLVKPLYDMGINGYIYYEPSRKELMQAIHSVFGGNNYKPEYLIHT